MGCPWDRVNGGLGETGREKLVPRSEGQAGEETGMENKVFKPITVCFCTVMNQGNLNQLQ